MWQAFPCLDESIAYSAHGPIKQFFQIKEGVFLNTVAEQGQLGVGLMDKEGERKNSDVMASVFDKYIRDELYGDGCRKLTPFIRKMIALENDWDFVFDSYECQSPMFISELEVSNAIES